MKSTHCELLFSWRCCFSSGICEPMMDWTVTKRSYPLSMRRIVSAGTLCVVRLHINIETHKQTDARKYMKYIKLASTAICSLSGKMLILLMFSIQNKCNCNSSHLASSRGLCLHQVSGSRKSTLYPCFSA